MGKYGFKVLNKKILKCFSPSFLAQTVQQQYNYLSLSLPFTCKWEVRTNVDWIQSFAFSSIDMMSFAKDISNASLLDLSVSSSLEVNRSMETNILLIDYVIRHIYSLIDGFQMDRLPMSVMKSAAPPPLPPRSLETLSSVTQWQPATVSGREIDTRVSAWRAWPERRPLDGRRGPAGECRPVAAETGLRFRNLKIGPGTERGSGWAP